MHDEHAERVKKELVQAGLSKIAMFRFSTAFAHKIIRADEHIHAAVYGHREVEPGGIFGYEEGLIIATNQRIIYLVHRPGFTKTDEMGYDMVRGVKISYAGMFCSIQLHTLHGKIGTFKLAFARRRPARRFVDFVNEHSISKSID